MEMLLLSEERECGKMKKKKNQVYQFLYVNSSCCGTAHATEKERGTHGSRQLQKKYCGFMYWQTVMPRTTRM